jgi:hypothetical protein
MNPNHTPWDRLAAAARRAPALDERETAAPYWFATRVAALGLAAKPESSSLFDPFSLRISLRALGVACAMAVIAAGTSYPTIVKLFADNVSPADTFSYSMPAESPAAPDAASVSAPAAEVPAPAATAAPATGDDPVAELLDMVS